MLPNVVPENAKSFALFNGLKDIDKERLIRSGRIHKCRQGQMLFLHGDPVAHFYILMEGIIQLFRETSEGQEKTIHIINAGQPMCESEILDRCTSHRMSAVIIEDATLLEFPVPWLKEAAKTYTEFALNLLSLVAQQAYLAEIEAEHQASLSAPQLVACFLQRVCMMHDFDPKGFELPYSKTLIASRLGMELETFSRALSKLKDNGIVVTGTKVSILDMHLVEEYVCQACSVADDCVTHKGLRREKDAIGDKKYF